MTHVRDLHEQWMQDPAYRNAYEQLEPEFALARALIEARTKAGLTQEQLARACTHAVRDCSTGGRSGATFNPNARAFCQSNGYAAENQL